MISKSALVLEGGALRSVYAAGVLDVFMENKIDFKYVLGVSAGALNAGNYISGQIGRSARVNIDYVNDPRYIGLRHLLKEGSIFNFDFLFGEPTKEWMPYNEKAFMNSKQQYVIGATNCITGKQEFFERHTYKELVEVLTASSTLPVLSKLAYITGVPYIDGGVSNAIPFKKAQKDGYKKIVIILTRPKGYYSKRNIILNQFFKVYYRKYPNLVKKLCTMSDRYNTLLNQINKLEKEGKVFVIQPTITLKVSRVERNQNKLRHLYLEGKEDARILLPMMLEYIGR